MLSILITANASQATAQLARTNAQLNQTAASGVRAGAATSRFGGAAKTAAVGGVAAFGYALVKGVGASMEFEKQMTLIHTQAGASAKEVENLSGKVLDLSKSGSEFGPIELARGLFRVESAGYRGARAMEVLDAAQRLADVGQADLEGTTNALVGAMNTGIKGSGDLEKAIGSLNAIVGAGNMRMEDLVSAMGTGFLSNAKQMGLSLNQAGAMLAALTAQGQPATQAATRLSMAFRQMMSPTDQAKDSLEAIGIESERLGILMQKGKAPEALGLLVEKLDALGDDPKGRQKAAQVVRDLFGARSASGINAILQGLDDYRDRLKQVNEESGKFKEKEIADNNTLSSQWDELTAKVEAYGIELGDVAKGPLTDFLKFVNQSLPDPESSLPKAGQGGSSLDTLKDDWKALKDTVAGGLKIDFSGGIVDAKKLWGTVKGVISKGIKFSLIVPAQDAFATAKGIWNKVKGVISDAIKFALSFNPISWFTNKATAIWNAIKDALPSIKIDIDLPDIPSGKGGVLGTGIGNNPFNARGTSYFGGGMSVVGEEGPELAMLPRGTAIYPASQTRKFLNNLPAFAKGTPGNPDLSNIGNLIFLGHTLQDMGYQVGEHPKFGGVAPGVHSPTGYHPKGMAIDVNHGGNEGSFLDRIAGPLRNNPKVLELLWRVADHFDHLHVAMPATGPKYINPAKAGGKAGKPRKPESAKKVFGSRYSVNELRTLAASVGMPQSEVMAAIAFAESRGNPGAVGGDGERGLWQILGSTAEHFGLNWGSMFNPVENAKGAKKILAGQGLSAWSVYKNGAYKKYLGGKVLKKKLQRLKGAATGGKVRGLLGKVKKMGLDPKLQAAINKHTADAGIFEEYASRAEQLEGAVNGKDEIGWLTDELTSLFNLRNVLVKAQEQLAAVRDRLQQLLRQAQKELRALRGVSNPSRAQKNRMKYLHDKLIPGIKDQRDLVTDKREEVLGSLTDTQGVGSPMNVLGSVPAVGVLGGQIFDVQMALKDAGGKESGQSADSGLADLHKQLAIANAQRFAVSEAQFKVLQGGLPPFAGTFHQGGIVPGPMGAERYALVKSGERISPAGGDGVVVYIEKGAGVDPSKIRVIAAEEAEKISFHKARTAGRVMPGSAGSLRG